MFKYLAGEDGEFGLDFDQLYQGLFPDELGVGAVAQGLLVAPERERRVKIPAGTPVKPRLTQERQSRITVALDGTDPKFAYRPAESSHPNVGVRFDRENAAGSLAGRGLDSRPTLSTARRRQTTIPLSGQLPLEPTHRLINLNVPFETVAVALTSGPSEFKLETLTNGTGGLAFPSSQNRYRKLLNKLAETERISAETEPSIEKTEPSEDLNSEIPW